MRLLRSFSFAWRGIKYCFTTQVNFRIHLILFGVVALMAFFFSCSTLEWLSILLASGAVFVAEAINTSLEILADVVDKNHNEGLGKAKDVAAGAVLLSAFFAVLVGAIIFIPKLIMLVN